MFAQRSKPALPARLPGMRALPALLALLLALPVAAADPAKVLRLALEQAESTFDPALFQDTYSSTISGAVIGEWCG